MRRALLILSVLSLAACQSTSPRVRLVSVSADEWVIDPHSCLALYRPSVELRWQYSGGSLRHLDLMNAFTETLTQRQLHVLEAHSSLGIQPAGSIDAATTGALFRRLGLTLMQRRDPDLLKTLSIDPSGLPDKTECAYGAVLIFDAWLIQGQSRPSRQQLLWAVWSTDQGRLMMLASSEQLSLSHGDLSDRIDADLVTLLEQLP